MEATETIIGIDLGTTNSLAAAVGEQGPEALRVPGSDTPIVPSVLTRREGAWIVGAQAREMRTTHPEETIFSVKRLMGRDIDELASALARLPYSVQAAQRGLVEVKVGQESFTPQELSAQILTQVRADAEAAQGGPVSKAVITVPAYFDDAQRQATRAAPKSGAPAAKSMKKTAAS